MARPQSTSGGRPVVVTVRLSEAEARVLDGLRGGLSRSEAIRRLILRGRTESPSPSASEPLADPTMGHESGL